MNNKLTNEQIVLESLQKVVNNGEILDNKLFIKEIDLIVTTEIVSIKTEKDFVMAELIFSINNGEFNDVFIESTAGIGKSEEEALKEISKFYKQPKKIYNALEELEKLSKSKDSIIEVPKVENSTIIEKRKVTVPTIKRDINREGTVVNIDTNLAVRRGAGEENYVVGYLLAAQRVNVMQEIGDWYKIVYQSTIGKRIGFVEKYFIKLG